MRIPLAWLRDYVDLPADVDAIGAKLASLGFPVADVEQRPHISGVVVGTIVRCEKHPNADKLQICTIDIGSPQTLTIATAATNVAAGQVVPVATIGAQLPQMRIEPRKMRGIDSQGMLCSAEELALPAAWFEDGIMQLDASCVNGTDVVALFGLHLPILDVEIGANRGDALSMVGIARELAAGFGTALRMPELDVQPFAQDLADGDVRVTLETLDVRRYVAQRVTNLRVRTAPAAMRVRLALAGQRPLNNLVDISNFAMLELGQPLHFFDDATLAGRHIIVRDGRAGESLVTLDGVRRELDDTALVIADDTQAVGLAGLMGGNISEVSDATTAVIIESANFSGPRIRRMSVALGLRTEASTRNEKGLPVAFADVGAARAAYLLAREGGTVHAPRGYGAPSPPPPPIALHASEVGRLLGFTVDDATIDASLRALGFTIAAAADGVRNVVVPPWRTDVTIAADLVEEVARVVGYDRVEATLPAFTAPSLVSDEFEREMLVAQTLVGLGYLECLTLALQPHKLAQRWRALGIDIPAPVEIRNPLSEDQRFLRFSLLPALLEHAARWRATRPLRTFEIGRVFADAQPDPIETPQVTLLATLPRAAGEPAWRDAAYLSTASDVRALVHAVTGRDARLERGTAPGLHPGKTAALVVDDGIAGYVGVIDPRLLHDAGIDDAVVAAVLDLHALPAYLAPRYHPLSRFPAAERDLALIVGLDVPAGDLLATVRAASPLVRSAQVFDEYRGPQIDRDRKSIAIRVVLQRDDSTLTDSDADGAVGAIVTAVRNAHRATLRE